MKLFKKNNYLDKGLSKGFISLYTGRMIAQLSSGIGGLFLPIFLYTIFGLKLQYVVLFYIVNFLLCVVFIPYGAKFLNSFGFKKSLQLSILFGALFYASFYFINESNVFYLIILPIIIVNLFRLTYWIPYHIDFAKFTDKKSRGKEFSIMESTRLFISVLSPILVGFLVQKFDFEIMFIMGVVIYFLSGIPYLNIPRTREKFIWSYKKTWQEFFSKKSRGVVFAYMADGAENVVGVVVWPIFIWELLNGDFFKVGAISALIIAVTVVLQLILGKYTDKLDKKKILRLGSIFYSFGWIIKIFVITAFQIFITATYHNLSRIFFRTPLDVLTYEIAADQGHYVDEFTVIHEMAINAGRVLMLVFVLIFTLIFGFSVEWTFALAAMAVLAVNFLEFKKLK